MRVLISGEGANEIGGWALAVPYRADPPTPGVVEALLRKLSVDGWTVHDGRLWKSVRKYRAGHHRQPETRTVLGLALAAKESNCDALVFIRDQDHDSARLNDISAGLREASANWPELKLAGGVAVPCLEGWLLALQGTCNSESLRKSAAIQLLANAGVAAKNTESMVQLVETINLSRIPEDAEMLRAWLERAGEVLGRQMPAD